MLDLLDLLGEPVRGVWSAFRCAWLLSLSQSTFFAPFGNLPPFSVPMPTAAPGVLSVLLPSLGCASLSSQVSLEPLFVFPLRFQPQFVAPLLPVVAAATSTRQPAWLRFP